jgi:hypothetical protein
MMQSMKGATQLLGSMNRQMNLPALQRIAMEFEKENDIMDQRQEMMDDAIDDVTGLEDEEESEEVVNQVLDEIGIDLGSAVWFTTFIYAADSVLMQVYSLVRRRRDCRRLVCKRGGLRRQLEEVMQVMMIYRLDLTVCGGEVSLAFTERTCPINPTGSILMAS